MKICFVTDSFLKHVSDRVTGVQVQTYYLARAFSDAGHEVSFVSEARRSRMKTESFGNLMVFRVTRRNWPLGFLITSISIYRLIKRINPDVCYQRGRSYFGAVAAFACKRMGARFVWASAGEHGCRPGKYRRELARRRNLTVRSLLFPDAFIRDVFIGYSIRSSHHCVVQTEFQRAELFRYFGKRGVVMPVGLPLDKPRQRNAEETKTILWIASVSAGKQPEIFIELAGRLSYIHGCVFVMAGPASDRYRREVERRSAHLENFRFLGPISFAESWNLFSNAHVFVNSSLADSEGFPNSFVQSWLCGTPTVSLNVDPDNFIEEHNLGFCSGSFEKLCNDVMTLVEDDALWALQSRNAKDFARKNLDIQNISIQYLSLFS